MEGLGFDTAAVLPPFNRLVFDEAHSMEKTATSFFSRVFTKNSVLRQLNRLISVRKGKKRGLLVFLKKVLIDQMQFVELETKLYKVSNEINVLNVF